VLFAYVEGFQSTNIVGVILSVGAAIGAAFYKVGTQVAGMRKRGVSLLFWLIMELNTVVQVKS